jgi:hypothetical protein
MKSKAWVILGAWAASVALPEVAEACGGGGVVSSRPGSVGANAQRVFISVHDDGVGGSFDGTDVITQINVPATTDDYGALLPLPSEPTLDSRPVAAQELEQLDMATAPQLLETEDSGGSGFSCACAGSAAGESKGSRASVSEPVDIGPVTAVVLTGTTDAVNGWLGDNGFVISAADQAMIADYAGYYFVAIRRNDRAAPGGPTSIGIHFSMPGDHRELPLRFASLGAASTVTFTLFIATSETVGPSPPFAALTLDDLDGSILRFMGYRQAVQSAIRAHDNRAFVLESSTPSAEIFGLAGTTIGSLLGGTTVTRMTTILPAEALTEDAHFYDPYPGEVPNERNLNAHNALRSREANFGALTALVLLGMWRRRNRPALGRALGTGVGSS